MEEFKKCLPDRVVVYLNEQKVNVLSVAAVLANEYALTHKTILLISLVMLRLCRIILLNWASKIKRRENVFIATGLDMSSPIV